MLLLSILPLAIQIVATNSLSLAVLHSEFGKHWSFRAGRLITEQIPAPQRARLLGQLLLAQGDDKTALDVLRMGVQGTPHEPMLLVHLAEAYDRVGQARAARDAWRQAGGSFQLLKQGEQAVASGQWEEAFASLEAARALDPADPAVVRTIVRVYRDEGHERLAAEVLRDALAADPDSNPIEHRLELGRSLENLGAWDEAERVYRDTIAAVPDDPQGYVRLAETLHCAGLSLPVVLVELDRALAIDSTFVEAHTTRGQILRAEARYEEALASFRTASTLAPDDFWPIAGLAQALMDMNDVAAAIDVLNEASTRFPDQPHLFYLLAYAYQSTGEFDSAVAAAERAVSQEPKREAFLLTLARTYEAAGRVQDALKTYQALLALHPGHQEAQDSVARLQSPEPQ